MPFVADSPEVAAKKSGFVPDEPTAALVDPRNAPEAQMGEKAAVDVRSAAGKEREIFIRQNVQPGVVLDVDAELPAAMRARLSAEPNVDKQTELLTKQEGVLGARKSKDGRNVIVRVTGDDGKPKDVLLHPKTTTLTAGDVAGATVPLMKAGGAAGLAVATAGTSLPLTAATMGVGSALMEGGTTALSRTLGRQDIDPKEIAFTAGKEGLVNAAAPLVATGVKEGSKFLMGKLGGEGATEVATKSAASKLGLPLTKSMERDSNVLRGIEPKANRPFEEAQQGALKAAKDRELGLSGPAGVLSESDVAERVGPAAAGAEMRGARGVRTAMTDAEKAAQAQIQAELDSGLVPTTRSTSEVGDFIREKIAGRAPDSKASQLRSGAKKLYDEANTLAEAEGIVVEPSNVSSLAKKLTADDKKALLELAPGIRKIPSIARVLTEGEPAVEAQASGLMDEFGRPLMAGAKEAVPPPPLTVQNARELRSVIFDMEQAGLAPGEAGVPGRYLRDLYKAIDQDIDAAIAKGSPELKKATGAADEFYRTNITPLQQSDVAKLFLETDAAGRLGGDEIVRRLFTGKGNLDALKAYRQVLGETSPEYKLLLRQGMNTLLEDAGARSGLIDAGKFLNRLGGLSDELVEEALGPSAKAIRGNATLMNRAQGVKLTEEELVDAIAASPGKAPNLLIQAINREAAHDATYNTMLQKQLRDGTLGPRTMGRADDFVERFIFSKAASESEIKQALTQIAAADPAAAEGIRQQTLQKLLRDAQPSRANELMDAEKLLRFAKDKEFAGARQAIGPNGVKFIEDLATYMTANEKRIAGKSIEPAATDVAGRAGAAAIGHKVSLVRLAGDLAGAPARGAVNVVEFLANGSLPRLGPLAGTGRAAILAAPEAIEAGKAVTAEKPRGSDEPPALKPKRKFKVTEVSK